MLALTITSAEKFLATLPRSSSVLVSIGASQSITFAIPSELSRDVNDTAEFAFYYLAGFAAKSYGKNAKIIKIRDFHQ